MAVETCKATKNAAGAPKTVNSAIRSQWSGIVKGPYKSHAARPSTSVTPR